MNLVTKPAALALLALLIPSRAAGGEITKHYDESLIAMGEAGVFSFELLPQRHGLMMGVNSLEIIIHDASDRDVPGASVTVTPWMPEHGHGVVPGADVTDRGGGVYTVDNLMFTMTGRWELTVEAAKGGRSDRAVFVFPDVRASGHGGEAAAAGDVDWATVTASAQGLFTVGYESSVAPPPLNEIHRWTLEIRTSDGDPVTGAAVSVVGDMPEHGHGLPTQPEMTGELPGGKYVVDGIRFSMPGHWVLTFHVVAGEVTDNASFDVMVR